MNGWFPVPHDIVDSPIFQDADSLRLFIWLSKRAAIKTQHVPMTTGRGQAVITLERGQCIVGRKQSSLPLGWSEDKFRYRLEKLATVGLITKKCATHWTVIEVVNYGISESSAENYTQPNPQPNPQPNATQTPNQTPQRNKTKKTKKTNKTEEDKNLLSDLSDEPPNELDQWIGLWNSWHASGLVSSATSTKPNKGVTAGWNRVQKNAELRSLLSDRDAIEAAIRSSEFVRGPWFTLEKLFGGTNKEGAFIAQKLLDGCYRLTAKPARTANTGPGVTFSPDAHIGDPNYGRM